MEPGVFGDLFEELHPNTAADHRGRLQQCCGLAGEQIDARCQHAFDGRRQLSLVPARSDRPAVLVGEERAGVAHSTHELLHEVWIPARARLDEGKERFGRGTSENRVRESRDSLAVERRELE